MKRTMSIAAALAVSLAAAAAESDKAAKPQPQEAKPAASQQGRMKSCNEEAGKKGLKGEARRTFMSACLKR